MNAHQRRLERRARERREAREPRVARWSAEEEAEWLEENATEEDGVTPLYEAPPRVLFRPERDLHLLRAAVCLMAVAVLGFAAFVLRSF